MIVASLLLALALAQADPVAPTATASAGSEPPTATKPAGPGDDTPPGAPQDDFAFVGWCKGALNGHMELYTAVKPELVRLEHAGKETAEDAKLDQEQMAAGREYVALYTRALEAAEKAGGAEMHARGETAQAQGYRIWSAARAADDRTRMWSWLMWELPARCETAAKRLETRSDLFGEAFKPTVAAPAAPQGASESAPQDASGSAPAAAQPAPQ